MGLLRPCMPKVTNFKGKRWGHLRKYDLKNFCRFNNQALLSYLIIIRDPPQIMKEPNKNNQTPCFQSFEVC